MHFAIDSQGIIVKGLFCYNNFILGFDWQYWNSAEIGQINCYFPFYHWKIQFRNFKSLLIEKGSGYWMILFCMNYTFIIIFFGTIYNSVFVCSFVLKWKSYLCFLYLCFMFYDIKKKKFKKENSLSKSFLTYFSDFFPFLFSSSAKFIEFRKRDCKYRNFWFDRMPLKFWFYNYQKSRKNKERAQN